MTTMTHEGFFDFMTRLEKKAKSMGITLVDEVAPYDQPPQPQQPQQNEIVAPAGLKTCTTLTKDQCSAIVTYVARQNTGTKFLRRDIEATLPAFTASKGPSGAVTRFLDQSACALGIRYCGTRYGHRMWVKEAHISG